MYQLIKSNPGLNTSELRSRTKLAQRTIERWLKELKDNNTIEFRGAPKTGGYYTK